MSINLNQSLGILLASGNSTRLRPLTDAFSKHLLPVYNKPMIYYSLSLLMYANCRNIIIVTKTGDKELYKSLLGHGQDIGVNIEYVIQDTPDGIAAAVKTALDYAGTLYDNYVVALGDNLLHGSALPDLIGSCAQKSFLQNKSQCFFQRVRDPKRFGVGMFSDKNLIGIVEKPTKPPSQLASVGLYIIVKNDIRHFNDMQKSERGEFEITDIINKIIRENGIEYENLSRGVAWFDSGTFDGLNDASNYVRALETRQGLLVGSIHEIAANNGWIDRKISKRLQKKYIKSGYGKTIG